MQIGYTDVDSEQTPLGLLTLRRYEAETGEVGYEVAIDGNFLMASHGAHSERAMATLAHERLQRSPEQLHVLVGGLGAGHTLRAALDLPSVATVTVAEIGGKMEDWNRQYFSDVNGHAVADPRAKVVVADVADVLRDRPNGFDLLLLDVDNGPGWLAADGNAALYEPDGVQRCMDALRPGGVMAVWSPAANPRFQRTLELLAGEVEAVDTTVMGRAVGEPGDVIYLVVA